ncbi:uncharacterized protein Z520_04153 [Fonsecaea multimorphosa CBS 102226]|uniref:Transcription factor domain-containing protein n=1 Tax=Fonsecaea multimorphosa CBS 102226 TaxID=1442371 RepID=A0A0D2K3U2_9EURO|nr:uncharacterized protein Z520_04153 [Fonsecaea multimorphosa CBS 102226]KIY00468.1 hypothetical protein Z520_04153 [Fonsecaea multimorphosa CBS 102226]OAL26982.1 hypothetical protein AYO22_03926 [Fonsecaea multimorphosa]
MSQGGNVHLANLSSLQDASPQAESDSDLGSPDRIKSMTSSPLRILESEISSAQGSAFTLLRVKPVNFHALPLDATMVEDDLTPLATIQFFVEIYCPSMLRHPTFRLKSRDSVFMSANLSGMMQDPLITASSLALAIRIHDKGRSRKVVGYYRKALVLLQKRLKSDDRNSTNAILLSLIHLMAVESLSEDLGSPLHHLGAMRRMIQIRGELRSSGLQGYIKDHIRSWESFLGGVYAEPDPDQVRIFPYGSLDYPRHPFEPELSLALSRLPLGFIELAMSCRLSIQVIRIVQIGAQLMSDLFHQKQDFKQDDSLALPYPGSPVQLMCLAIVILQNQQRNMVEEVLAISLLALAISTEALEEHITTGYGYIQTYCMGLWDVDIERECRSTGALGLEDFLLWAKMLLLATFDYDTQTWRTAIQLRRDVPFPEFKSPNFEVCRQFFWTELLTLSLEQKMAQERALGKPPSLDGPASSETN